MKAFSRKIMWFGAVVWLIGALIATDSWAADINVYAEGAFTTDQAENILDVYIYADITVERVLSFGIRLTYDPLELEVVSAEKNIIFPESSGTPPYTSNPALWELGDDPAYRNNPAPDYTNYSDAVVIIGGKLDPADPTGGLNGERVFLAKVTFRPVTGNIIPSAPALGLTYAVGAGVDTYKNFVRYDPGAPAGEEGVVIDSADSSGVNFLPINVASPPYSIAARGDANADGVFNVQDYLRTRSYIGTTNFPAYADCNEDGLLNVQDYLCIRSKM
ncbi:MAG: hypothetical protein JSW26_02835 [Desulfobacterales bacterium]|nr:MAG: hypothetical protein JSW26_02835 [Desulfobacterales bacterium]